MYLKYPGGTRIAAFSVGVLAGVVKLAAKAWFEPSHDEPMLSKHGNPEAVTRDCRLRIGRKGVQRSPSS